MATQITLEFRENDLVRQLGAMAAEHGQDLEPFVESALAQIVQNHAASKETGLSSRMSTRFDGVGLQDGEELRSPRPDGVRDPFDEGP